MDTLLCKPLRGYKNIYRLGKRTEKQTHSLYKYMNVQRAIEFLETGQYYFVEPTLWADPYEKLFYTADYSNIGFIPRQCFCTCLTHNISSEAAWKMYRSNSGGIADRTIRLEFNKSALFKILEGNCKDMKFYFGNVNYEFTTKEINNLPLVSSLDYAKYFSEFNEEKFLHLLLIKRKAFQYESEIRLFVLPKSRDLISTSNDIKLKHSLIIEFQKKQLEKIVSSISIDPSCNDIECDMIKTKIEELFPDIKCTKNNLYKEKPRLIIR